MLSDGNGSETYIKISRIPIKLKSIKKRNKYNNGSFIENQVAPRRSVLKPELVLPLLSSTKNDNSYEPISKRICFASPQKKKVQFLDELRDNSNLAQLHVYRSIDSFEGKNKIRSSSNKVISLSKAKRENLENILSLSEVTKKDPTREEENIKLQSGQKIRLKPIKPRKKAEIKHIKQEPNEGSNQGCYLY
ncbi:MAG: hypothetical protein MJ252_12105 [archaeon]|nr:hypothetical protein [archaeon]